MNVDHGDPRERPLRLAIRSSRLLGLASAIYGVFFVFAYGYFNRFERYRLFFIGAGMVMWVVPGVLMIVSASAMRNQRRRSAAVWALVAASVQGLFAVGLFVAQFKLSPISPIPLALSAMWAAAIVQLIAHLRRSLPLLEIDAEQRHGFEVAAPAPAVQPVPTATAPSPSPAPAPANALPAKPAEADNGAA